MNIYCTSTELVVVPEPYRTLIKFLRQNTQKLFDRNLRHIFSVRVKLTLSESYFSFIFCRLVFENFDKENCFKYGTDTVRRQIR